MTRIRPARALCLLAVLALAGATAAQAGQPVFHGVFSQGYLNSSEYNYLIPSEPGSFAYNEAILNVSAPVTDNIRVGAQFIGRNFGISGNEQVALDWAYGDWRYRDEFGLRIGKVKTPYGFYNQTRDVDMVRTAIVLPQSVYTTRFRTIMSGFEGVSAYGSLGMGESAGLEYDVYVGTVDLDATRYGEDVVNRNAVAAAYGFQAPYASSASEMKSIAGAALRFNTPVEGLRVGGSMLRTQFSTRTNFFGPLGPFTTDLKLTVKDWYVLSAEYTADRLFLAAEFSRLWVNFDIDGLLVPTGLPDPYPPTTTISVNSGDFRGGYYGTAAWQFNDWFQFGSYYSVYYPDYNLRDGDYRTYQKDLAFTARFDLADYWLLKVETHFVDGVGDVTSSENPGSAFEADTWNLFGIKSTFYF